MKKLIIATTLVVSSLLALAGPSQAQSASVTISSGDGPRYYREHRDYRDHRDYQDRRYTNRARYVRDWDGPRHRCFTKKVRSYRHGELVVRTTRVCR